jgi:DNA-directed RNA polymerase specialized sigma24 family protein
VEPDGGAPLDAFLERHHCYIKQRLTGFAARILRHRPTTLLEPDDLVHDVVTRLLQNPSRREGDVARGLASFLSYLRTATTHAAINRDRSERGRMRCGNCTHYAPWSGRCLHPANPWTGRQLPPASDPRLLDPTCASYGSRKDTTSTEPEVLAATVAQAQDGPDSGELEEVQEALYALAQVMPRAALVVRARLLEGRSYKQLVALGPSLRTLKRDYAAGMAWLRSKLEQSS